MFASVFSFLLIAAQWSLLVLSYTKQWHELFNIIFIHLSPVMVFFALLEMVIGFAGEFSHILWIGLGVCVFKYFFLGRALVLEEYNFFNLAALLAEIAYVGLSSWYIIENSYVLGLT